jgi:hypothetical protein
LAGRPLAEIVDDLIAGGGREVRLGTADAFRQARRGCIKPPRGNPMRVPIEM